jgi:hypothetical protein
VAHKRVRFSGESDIDIADLREVLGPSYVQSNDADDDRERALTAIVQFAFFGAGKKAGAVDFSHPILAEHLAAGYALVLLRQAADRLAAVADSSGLSRAATIKAAVRQALGTARLEPGSIFCRTLMRGLQRHPPLAALIGSAQGLLGRDERQLAASVALLRQAPTP